MVLPLPTAPIPSFPLPQHIPMNPYAIHSLGINPGFGSSATALVLTEHLQEHHTIRVLYAEQIWRRRSIHPDPQMIIDKIFDIHRQYYDLLGFL